MDREQLVFEITANAEGIDAGFKKAGEAMEDLGDSYDDLQATQDRMQSKMDDLRSRLEVVKKATRAANIETGHMPRGLRQVTGAFKSAAAGAGTFAIAMLAIQAGIAIITKIKDAAEKAKKEFEKLKDEIRDLTSKTGGAEALVARFEQLQAKATRTKEETAEMNQISQNLVSTYGMRADAVDNEGRLLLRNLDYMKEQLSVYRQLLMVQMEAAQPDLTKGATAALKLWTQGQQHLADLRQLYELTGDDTYTTNIKMFEEKYREAYKTLLEYIEQTMLLTVAKVGDDIENIPTHIQAAVSGVLLEMINAGELPTAADAEEMLRNFLKFDAAVMEAAAIPQIQNLREKIVEAIALDGGGEDLSGMANEIMGLFTNDAALTSAFEAGTRLAKTIAEGAASEEDLAEYDQVRAQIVGALTDIQDEATRAFEAAGLPTEAISAAFSDLAGNYTQSGKDLADFHTKLRAAQTDTRKMTGTISGLTGALSSLNKEITDLADLRFAIEVIRDGATATDDYAAAVDFLANRYGVSADEVAANLEEYQRDADMKQALIELNYILALQEAITAQTTAQAMVEAGTATEQESARMIAALDGVIAKLQELGGADGLPFIPTGGSGYRPSYGSGPPRRTGGGGGTAKNSALEKELALIERKKRLDQITTEEEITLMWRAYNTLARTTAEKEQLYDKIYAAQKAAARQAYDDDVYYGRLTLEKQRERIKAMIRQYKAGTDARAQLERELYDLQQQIRDRDVEELNRLAEGVVGALRNRYEAQRDLEADTIRASIEDWQTWAKEQVAVIHEQIRALDDLTKGEDRAEEERKRRRKVAALEQQRAYETDAYNQRKLDEQIAAAKDELNKWLTRNEREDQKQALQEQAEAIQVQADREQDSLEKQLDNLDHYYDERLKQHNLEAEAQRLMTTSSQKGIIDLIRSFAPEYNAAGQDLGEQLFAGFQAKAINIADWIAGINLSVGNYQQTAAQAAASAAAAFWSGHGIPQAPAPATDPGAPVTTIPPIVINLYDGVESPAKLAAELERLIDRLSRS